MLYADDHNTSKARQEEGDMAKIYLKKVRGGSCNGCYFDKPKGKCMRPEILYDEMREYITKKKVTDMGVLLLARSAELEGK
jgi:hypothetical protein